MTHQPDLANLRPVNRHAPLTTLRVVVALMLREMTTTYGRSPGGYAWAVIEPVAAIALLTWVFALILRQPPLGTNFAMFYATGWLPFHVFLVVSQRTSQALGYSKHLLAYPRVTILDALLARFLLNLMLQLLVSCIVLAGIRLVYETGTTLVLSSILLAYAMAAALAAGIGVLNCFLFSRFPLWQNLWGILMRPVAIISGVMILIESLPDPWSSYLAWNPLAHVVAETRRGFYYGYHPDYVAPAYVFGVALVAGTVGLLFLWRYHRHIREL
jgi:capsular polysaccharide transport system permease protein